MAQCLEQVDLAAEALEVVGAAQEVAQLDLVPGHLHAVPLVEGSVHGLGGAAAQHVGVLVDGMGWDGMG